MHRVAVFGTGGVGARVLLFSVLHIAKGPRVRFGGFVQRLANVAAAVGRALQGVQIQQSPHCLNAAALLAQDGSVQRVIKGKALGVPVYKLLGGKTNDKLRAYASQLQFGWRKDIEAKDGLTLLYDPKDYYRVVKEAVDEGYDAVKIDPVFAPTEPAPMGDVMATQGTQIRGCYREHDLKRSVERIAAAREAGGPDMDIIVEIHSLLDANTSAELGKALEPYRIMYYEEPTMPCNADMFKHVKEKSGLPLATGERSYTRWGFRQFFEDRTLNVIQPDLANTGGITETKKICDMAQVYDIGVQIHVCGGPIATAAALQLEATIPNFVIHEEHNANLTSAFVKGGKYYYAPKDGYYTVPELPGIGQEMSEFYIANAKKVVIE